MSTAGSRDFDPKSIDLGKLVGRDQGEMTAVKLGIEAHNHSWDLISYTPNGEIVGVAAHGPIETLPIILQLLKSLGTSPKKADYPFKNGS